MFVFYLERADFVEGEEAEDDWADYAAIRNSAEAVSGIPRVGAFAVVTRDKEFAFWYGGVYFARSVFFRAVGVGSAPLCIINKAIWVFVVINSHYAIFYGDAFAREGDDALDNILIANVRWD